MDFQPTLFDIQPLTKPRYKEGMSLRERWWAFHTANLHVYTMLRGMAFELKQRGYRHCGIALLWERLRWESFVQTQGSGEYRLSNSYRSFYARFLMAREPELRDFFRTRPQPSEQRRLARQARLG